MPPPPDIQYAAPLNDAFQQISDGMDTIVAKFSQTIDNVNRVRWMLGITAQWWISHRLGEVRDELNKIIEVVEYAAEHQLPVLSLISTSFNWVHDVKTPISDLSFQTTEPANENMYKWSGDAATAYNTKAGGQKAAVDETVVKAEFISQWLFAIAKENVDYAAGLATIVTDLAGDFTQAAANTATVIGIPWAIDTLAESTGKLVTAGLNNLIDIGQRFIDAVGDVRDIATQVGDHTRLPDGAWPQAVRDRPA